jgi:hypothetical protein
MATPLPSVPFVVSLSNHEFAQRQWLRNSSFDNLRTNGLGD